MVLLLSAGPDPEREGASKRWGGAQKINLHRGEGKRGAVG